MGWDAWVTFGVVGLVLTFLAFTRVGPDAILVGGVALLLATGVLTADEALSGLANEGMVTVGVLYIVVAGLRETGGTSWIVQRLLGNPRSLTAALANVMAPVAAMSAFLNNTPVVAMFMPAVNDWAKQNRFSVSKLMIPLSYAAVLGGTCSLIGTSTNLIVSGLVLKESLPRIGLFEIAWVGLPATIIGLGFLLLFGQRLLPDRKPAITLEDDPREYTVEMSVEPNGPLVGRTIEQAGLRRLVGMFLAEIDREGHVLPAVGPQEILREKDRLIFVGIVDSVRDLQKIRGLKPVTDQVFKLDAARATRCLIEAVVSNNCPLAGQTIRDGKFRTVYNAVVIAVARSGERIHKKVGDIILRPADTLLLEAHPTFAEQHRNSKDFFLVSRVEDSRPLRHEKSVFALFILLAMIVAVTGQWLTMLQASMLAAGAMLILKCCNATVARNSVDWQVLVAIAAALGIGQAMNVTGAAEIVANKLILMAGQIPWVTLAVVYGITLLLTELITNNAAAVLMFPIAVATAGNLDLEVMPFVIVVMMASSAGFATPIGYQTHMMVFGPGGYRFSDFLRIGLVLDLLIWAVTIAIVPWVWPLHVAG